MDFQDAQGKPYKNTQVVKGKRDEPEEAPVYCNGDTIKGQVSSCACSLWFLHAQMHVRLWLVVCLCRTPAAQGAHL